MHYPEAILSNQTENTEAALEAAFAHYDEDFQSAIDEFIEANPPDGRTEATREVFMLTHPPLPPFVDTAPILFARHIT